MCIRDRVRPPVGPLLVRLRVLVAAGRGTAHRRGQDGDRASHRGEPKAHGDAEEAHPTQVAVRVGLTAAQVEARVEARAYAEQVARAIGELGHTFPGLSLHNRLAIVVPDTAFADALRAPLLAALSAQTSARRFELINAQRAAMMVLGGGQPQQRRGADGAEQLVIDSIAAFDGLERLIVIAVGLDALVADGASDALEAVEARSRLYRAITRAHMMVLVVNEMLPGGWLEFLNLLQLEREDFDSRVDVVPVSNPNVFSQSQRIMMAQTKLQLAGAAPELHNMPEIF